MDFVQDLEMDSVSVKGLNAENVGGDNASQQPMEIHPLPEGTASKCEEVQGETARLTSSPDEREDEVEIKKTLKFSYAAIFPTFAGLLTIFTIYFGKATELGPGISPLHVTAFLILTAFFSAGSMTLFASVRPCPAKVLIRVLKGLKYITLAFLVLAGVNIAFVFLEFWLLLAAAIPLVVTTVVIFLVFFNNC